MDLETEIYTDSVIITVQSIRTILNLDLFIKAGLRARLVGLHKFLSSDPFNFHIILYGIVIEYVWAGHDIAILYL